MHVHMNIKGALLIESFVAHLTMNWSLARMKVRMLFQDVRVSKGFWTKWTRIFPLASMQTLVISQNGFSFAFDVTLFALVDIFGGRVDGMRNFAMAEETFLKLNSVGKTILYILIFRSYLRGKHFSANITLDRTLLFVVTLHMTVDRHTALKSLWT
jgi:hypothetical protein